MNSMLALAHRLILRWRAADIGPVTLRPVRPDDADALLDFVRARSPASRRLRFHVALNKLSEAMIEAITCVDQRGHVAFVLTVAERGTERIVGEARHAVSGDLETAEFGIAVADAVQGQGLAVQLMAALIDAARARGLRWLIGEALAGNSRTLSFARRCGLAATTRGMEPGIVRVERSVDRSMRLAGAAGWVEFMRSNVRSPISPGDAAAAVALS